MKLDKPDDTASKQFAYFQKTGRGDPAHELALSFTGYLQGGSRYARGFDRDTGEPRYFCEVFIASKRQGFIGIKIEGPEATMAPAFMDIREGQQVRVTYTPVLSQAVKQGDRITQYQNNEFVSVQAIQQMDVTPHEDYRNQVPTDNMLDIHNVDPVDNRPRPPVY